FPRSQASLARARALRWRFEPAGGCHPVCQSGRRVHVSHALTPACLSYVEALFRECLQSSSVQRTNEGGSVKQREGIMQRRLLVAVAALLVVSAVIGVTASVEGRPQTLHGSYAVATVRSCTVTNNLNYTTNPIFTHFGPDRADLFALPTVLPTTIGVFRQEASDSAIETFNADGTGMVVGRSKTMNISATFNPQNPPPNPSPSILSISAFTIHFTFVVNDDQTVDISLSEFDAEILTGPLKGQFVKVGPRSARLQIADGGRALLTAPATTIEE